MPSDNTSILTNTYAAAITWPFRWLFWSSVLVVMSWLLAVFFAIVFEVYVWPQQAITKFDVSLQTLVGASLNTVSVTQQTNSGAVMMLNVSEWAYRVVFVLSGFEDMYFRAINGSPMGMGDKWLGNLILTYRNVFEAAMWGTRLWGAKMVLLLTSLPIFIAAYAVALVDGLMQRYIRREEGGRESSFIYHRAKHLYVMVVGTACTVLLLLPLSFPPALVIPGLAISLGFIVKFQWQFYKKYL